MSPAEWILLVILVGIAVAILVDYLNETRVKRQIEKFRNDMRGLQEDEEK